MYPCTEDVLHQILYLIERGKYAQAVREWAHHRREELQTCDACHYDEFGIVGHGCCMCLESKLRMLNLYIPSTEKLGLALQSAARKLHVYQERLH